MLRTSFNTINAENKNFLGKKFVGINRYNAYKIKVYSSTENLTKNVFHVSLYQG